MKSLLLVLFTIFSFSAQAWVSSEPIQKPYSFKFKMEANTFEYSQKAPTYEEAFEKAAQACYTHFKDGKRLTEDRGLDIIDVCANPRST